MREYEVLTGGEAMQTEENLKPTDSEEISKWYTPMQIITLIWVLGTNLGNISRYFSVTGTKYMWMNVTGLIILLAATVFFIVICVFKMQKSVYRLRYNICALTMLGFAMLMVWVAKPCILDLYEGPVTYTVKGYSAVNFKSGCKIVFTNEEGDPDSVKITKEQYDYISEDNPVNKYERVAWHTFTGPVNQGLTYAAHKYDLEITRYKRCGVVERVEKINRVY